MKRLLPFTLAILLLCCSCSHLAESSTVPEPSSESAETQSPIPETRPGYDFTFDAYRFDPASCGYRYNNGAATYVITQCGSDVKIEFESSIDPDMNMSVCRIGSETTYIKGETYYIDYEGKYPIPVTADASVAGWLLDELKTYGIFEYQDSVKIASESFDRLTASKTETPSDPVLDFDYDMYEVFFMWSDGKTYLGRYFDCSNPEKNLLSGDVPEEILNDPAWAIDLENKRLYNKSDGRSFDATITLVDSYHYDESSMEPTIKTAEILIDRETLKVFQVRIVSADQENEYTLLYPDTISPLDISGLAIMDEETLEYTATMILIMLKSL